MYTSEKIIFDTLSLDKYNPRFTTSSDHNPSEKDIMEYLIQYEFVIDLAESILNFGGLVPGERLLVYKDQKQNYIVLEGNRRTAAISLLLEPQFYLDNLSLNTRDTKRITNFKSTVSVKFKKQLQSFEVDTVIDRDQAMYSLAERHIEGIRTWSQVSKMYFYQQHLESGKDINEIKKYSPESTRTIADYLRKYSFFRFVFDSYKEEFPDAKFSKTEFETTIPTELIIQRVFNSLKDHLEIEFHSKTYQMLLRKYNRKQLELLKKIFANISYLYWDLEKINTRNLNTKKDFEEVFFKPKHNSSSEESIKIGRLVIELKKSLENNEDKQEELDLNGDDAFNDLEQPSSNDIHDGPDNEPAELDNLDNKDAGENIEQDEDNQDQQVTDDNEDKPIGRLRTPDSYKYLTTAYLVDKNFKKNPRINAIKVELDSLDYKKFKLSAMFLIRSLLETYTHVYIDHFSNLPYDDPHKMKHIAKQRKDRKGKSLADLLTNNIYHHLKDVLDNYAETYELIQTSLSHNNNTALTQIINYHIHSTNIVPEKSEILNSWEKAVVIINTLDKILLDYGQND